MLAVSVAFAYLGVFCSCCRWHKKCMDTLLMHQVHVSGVDLMPPG